MTTSSSPSAGGADPSVLATLSSDDWAALLVATRAELRTRTDLGADLAVVRDTPTGRLVAGSGRDTVVAALSADAALWTAVLDRLPDEVAARLMPPPGDEVADVHGAAVADGAAVAQLREELGRARARARALREERDTWQRRAEGADARALRAEAAQRTAEQQRRDLQDALDRARSVLTQADEERARAVERERRRRDSEHQRLAEENAALRRREEEHLAAERRRAAQQPRRGPVSADVPAHEPAPRVVPGRPTRLPQDMVPGTTAWARALLGPGRLVLVDGYNVSRQHQGGRDLEGQRVWLVQVLVNAAAVHRWRPVVVFDGQQAGGRLPAVGRQRVEVRFTGEGITADDELVLAVEGTDEPVVVVTDDRELQDRVRAVDADVVGTTAFLSVARG